MVNIKQKSIVPKFLIAVFALSIVLFNGCFIDSKNTRETPKPSLEEDFVFVETQISGFSGLCMGNDKETFYAVSDKFGIYEINRSGNTIKKFPYSGNNDWEAITKNPENGDIYLADERQMTIYKLSVDKNSVSKITNIEISGGKPNKGLEGIAFGNDTLYIVNQESPTLLIKYSLITKIETSRKKLSFASYLSDIFFDNTDQTLWIVDSKQQNIFHCDLSGNLLSTQSIKFIPKPEAIYIESSIKTAWIGCDETGRLYRVRLTN